MGLVEYNTSEGRLIVSNSRLECIVACVLLEYDYEMYLSCFREEGGLCHFIDLSSRLVS